MTYEQIEAFLSAVTYGTLSSAAEHLYISQSAVSARIHQLETELNVPLLIRGKGHKSVELTQYGTAFIPLASQWASLWKNTLNLQTIQPVQNLVISSIDSVSNHTLVPFFNQLIDTKPKIRLTINTFHSNEIHSIVQSRLADIGFVFSDTNYPDLVSRPVYRELMYLVCRNDSPYHNGISCSELNPADEIYLKWGQDYQNWHDSRFPQGTAPAITVNTGSTIMPYLTRPERWGIAPMSVIRSMMTSGSTITYYTLKEPPAPRICYEITNRYPSIGQKQIIDEFDKLLTDFISRDPAVCSFESWMLKDA